MGKHIYDVHDQSAWHCTAPLRCSRQRTGILPELCTPTCWGWCPVGQGGWYLLDFSAGIQQQPNDGKDLLLREIYRLLSPDGASGQCVLDSVVHASVLLAPQEDDDRSVCEAGGTCRRRQRDQDVSSPGGLTSCDSCGQAEIGRKAAAAWEKSSAERLPAQFLTGSPLLRVKRERERRKKEDITIKRCVVHGHWYTQNKPPSGEMSCHNNSSQSKRHARRPSVSRSMERRSTWGSRKGRATRLNPAWQVKEDGRSLPRKRPPKRNRMPGFLRFDWRRLGTPSPLFEQKKRSWPFFCCGSPMA